MYKRFKIKKSLHFKYAHLPYANFTCLVCVNLITSKDELLQMKDHCKNYHGIDSIIENIHYKKSFPNSDNERTLVLKRDSVFGTLFLNGLDHPVTASLCKW